MQQIIKHIVVSSVRGARQTKTELSLIVLATWERCRE
jgi:hypothetical protein